MDIREMDDELNMAKADAERHARGQRPLSMYYLYAYPDGAESIRRMPNEKTITQTMHDPSMPGQVQRVYLDKTYKAGNACDVRELRGPELVEYAQKFYDEALNKARAEDAETAAAQAKGKTNAKGPRRRPARLA